MDEKLPINTKEYISTKEDESFADLESVAHSVVTSLEEVGDINDNIGKLLKDENIPDNEKQVFEKELESLNNNTLSLKKRLENILEKAVEIGFYPLIKSIEIYSELFGETKRKKKTLSFVLKHVTEEIDLSTYEKYGYYSIPEIDFSLKDENVIFLELASVKQIKYSYEIADVIKKANGYYFLYKKGVSVDLLKIIEISFFERDWQSIFDEEFIEKLKLFDKTDLKISKRPINVNLIKQFSLDQIQLLIQNPFINISLKKDEYLFSDLSKFLSLENLEKVKKWDANLTEISINDFVSFCRLFEEDVNKNVLDIYRKLYSSGVPIYDIYIQQHRNLDMYFASQGEDKLKIIRDAICDHDYNINYLHSTTRRKIFEILNQSIFDRCERLNINFKDRGDKELFNINKLTENQFNFLLSIRGEYEYQGIDLSDLLNVTIVLSEYFDFIKPETVKIIYYIKKLDLIDLLTRNRLIAKSLKNIIEVIGDDYELLNLLFLVYAEDPTLIISELLDDYFNQDDNLKNKKIYVAVNKLKNNPEQFFMDFFDSRTRDHVERLTCLFINFDEINNSLQRYNYSFSQKVIDKIFFMMDLYIPQNFLFENTFPLNDEMKQKIVDSFVEIKIPSIVGQFELFDRLYLKDNVNRQQILDKIFDKAMNECPLDLASSQIFPFTEEQKKYIDIFNDLKQSTSAELKNLANEIIPIIARNRDINDARKALHEIERVFVTNNMPFVGKQYKVFDILYQGKTLERRVKNSSVKSLALKEAKESSRIRFIIFKDLIRSHIASCDSNLYEYLMFMRDNKEILSRFENGQDLQDTERLKLKLFFKKINVLSGNIGRYSIEISNDTSDKVLSEELEKIKKSFDGDKNTGLIERFERTFLHRVGIQSVEEALNKMNQYKHNAHHRNIKSAESGVVKAEEGDYIKGVNIDFFDTYLDRGVYAPEFIGAESQNAVSLGKYSDMTPFDTDVSRLDSDGFKINGYGNMHILLKQKAQFTQDELEIFKINTDSHYGIRTGFGSTNIDAVFLDNTDKIDTISYFIAQKGFYIPICDTTGKVLFTIDDYYRYRRFFAGVSTFSKDKIHLEDELNKNEDINTNKQTVENIEKIENVKSIIIDKIKKILQDKGVSLHGGEYDDSLLGATITDTGSTGRGSALDDKFDFDFVVRLDDTDWSGVNSFMSELSNVFEKADSYENRGMIMFRSKELNIDGHDMTIDIGFVKKSESNVLGAFNALKQKYQSIERLYGKQKLLDVLTNIRFAKKKLKEAGCYKKGLEGSGQEGGLGGIGVEYWILQNGGDAKKAFKDFIDNAYENGKVLSFNEFKKKYKIFSVGGDVRGGIKVENFVYNMSETGYEKMVELAKKIISD